MSHYLLFTYAIYSFIHHALLKHQEALFSPYQSSWLIAIFYRTVFHFISRLFYCIVLLYSVGLRLFTQRLHF